MLKEGGTLQCACQNIVEQKETFNSEFRYNASDNKRVLMKFVYSRQKSFHVEHAVKTRSSALSLNLYASTD